MILDEATARLDLATQQLLARAMARLFAGRTAIIIAHRLETVEKADEILVLEAGRIAEHDAREVLVRDPKSRFSQMLRAGVAEVLV